MCMRNKPFVKWAGGKRQLLPELKAHMPSHFNRYYEPFIGGGALFLDLCPKRAVINDSNEQLLNVYRQIKGNEQDLIQYICELDKDGCDNQKYISLREKYNAKIRNREMDTECAALLIWLNKHCFNGLYRVNSRGLFNVPYNNKKNGASIEQNNIESIGQYLRQPGIELRQGDFESACEDVKPGDFVYFDSPYVPLNTTSKFTDYTQGGFTMEDHKRLADLFHKLSNAGVKVMLSNHDVPLVRELYDGYHIDVVHVRRAINSNSNKRKGTEVIITN